MTLTSHRTARFLLAAALFTAFAAPAGAEDFSSLEERMSEAEFRAAGLDKLSEQELAALNAWLRSRAGSGSTMAGGYVPAPAPAADRTGFRDSESGSVVSRIAGRFTGWDGDTRFTLENGQVWQQSETGSLRGVNVESPAVSIEPGMFGSWQMKVEGFNKRVRVRRVE